MDPQPSKYQTIWSADDPDQEEFLSETDVDVSNEKAWNPEDGRGRWNQPRGILYTLKTHRWLIDTSLLLVITVLLVLLLLRPPQPEIRQVGSDFTGSGNQCKSLSKF